MVQVLRPDALYAHLPPADGGRPALQVPDLAAVTYAAADGEDRRGFTG